MPIASDLAQALDPVLWARERLQFEADEQQAAVLRSSARRGLLCCTRQWGKSTTTAAKALHVAEYEPGSLSVVIAPGLRQAAELVRKCETFAARLGYQPRGDGDSPVSLLLPNSSRIVGLPGNEATVRGYGNVRLLLIDEAARVSDALYQAVQAFVAIGGGAVWLMSTPFGRRGFFWREWERGGERWQRHRVPASACPRIPAEFLAEQRAAMTEWWYRQEYECEFVDASGGFFGHEGVLSSLSDEVEALEL